MGPALFAVLVAAALSGLVGFALLDAALPAGVALIAFAVALIAWAVKKAIDNLS